MWSIAFDACLAYNIVDDLVDVTFQLSWCYLGFRRMYAVSTMIKPNWYNYLRGCP